MKLHWFTFGLALMFSPAAWADNVAHCEVLLVQNVEAPELGGTMQITAYHPAVSFIASVYDEDPEYLTQLDGHNIQALLCRRNELIPAETDYPMMATGVPFVLSQDFDRADTDSLTMFWKDGAFDYVYKGHPLSDEAQSLLETRLADFSSRKLEADEAAAKLEGDAETDLDADIAPDNAETANPETTDLETGDSEPVEPQDSETDLDLDVEITDPETSVAETAVSETIDAGTADPQIDEATLIFADSLGVETETEADNSLDTETNPSTDSDTVTETDTKTQAEIEADLDAEIQSLIESNSDADK